MLCAGDETAPREGARVRRGRPLTAPAGGIPVLIVDDDQDFCAAVVRALAATPFLPFTVQGGVEALRFLARVAPFEDAPRPAFVVLDFNLPDLDAPALLADMRADPLRRTIPVVVLSQMPAMADEHAALRAGAQGYHAKPSRAAVLRELFIDFWRTHAGPHGDPGR